MLVEKNSQLYVKKSIFLRNLNLFNTEEKKTKNQMNQQSILSVFEALNSIIQKIQTEFLCLYNLCKNMKLLNVHYILNL